jgi:hypothetical protein
MFHHRSQVVCKTWCQALTVRIREGSFLFTEVCCSEGTDLWAEVGWNQVSRCRAGMSRARYQVNPSRWQAADLQPLIQEVHPRRYDRCSPAPPDNTRRRTWQQRIIPSAGCAGTKSAVDRLSACPLVRTRLIFPHSEFRVNYQGRSINVNSPLHHPPPPFKLRTADALTDSEVTYLSTKFETVTGVE